MKIKLSAASTLATTSRLAALIGILTAWSPSTFAQQLPNRLPPAAEPGRDLRQPQPVQPLPEGSAIAVPQAPAAHPPPGAAGISFTLSKVTVEGATALSPRELEPLYAPLIGRTVTVADVFAAAAAIENRYREKGYIITRVLVPEQQIEGGSVRLVVVEGYISEIAFAQNAGASIGAARAQVEALLAPLRDVKPVDIAAIERRLLLANDLPGVQVRGTLQPSTGTRGAATLVIAAQRDPVDVGLQVDNRNSPYTGEDEAILRGSLNSFSSNAATVSLVAKSAFPYRREHFAQASYDQSVGSNGMTAGVTVFAARSRPGLNIQPLDVDSTVESASASVAYPLIRSRRVKLKLDGTFDYTDLDTDVLDRPYTRDRLRVLRLGATFDRSDGWNGVNAGRVVISQGLDIFGASQPRGELLSRYEGRSDFTKIGVQFSRLQTFTQNWSLLASAVGQVTWDSLLASEQIGLGGPDFGRGYDISEVSGDKGVDGALELRFRPSGVSPFWNATQFFAAYDLGKVWNVGIEYPQEESLASAGLGVRVRLPGDLFASFEVAKPLTHGVASEGGDRPTRVFFSISTQL
ncbi:MAG TPA: POTRA domain-containing protein [Steroidobacteraceae bacterium]